MSTVLKLPRRSYAQYADKPKFQAWLNIAHEMGENVATGAEAVRNCLDIDTATGESLRIISRIVAVDTIKQETLMNAGEYADPTGTEYGNLEKTLPSGVRRPNLALLTSYFGQYAAPRF